MLAFATTAAAAEQAGDVLTLDDALAIAGQHNIQVENAGLAVVRAERRVAAVKTFRLPKIDVSVLTAHHLTDESFTFRRGDLGTIDGTPVPRHDEEISTTPGWTTVLSTGALSSQVLAVAMERLDAFQASLPPGYQLRYGGELEKQRQSFGELVTIMVISGALIFSALVIQFSSAIKPLLVFAAVPYGVVGALFGLWVTGQPFGFMGFLGIARRCTSGRCGSRSAMRRSAASRWRPSSSCSW